MIIINHQLHLPESDISFSFMLASGPGGQNVNKTASAVQLRFNVYTSSLPQAVRERLIAFLGNKLTKQGDLIIKAYRHRTQERNKQDALQRFIEIVKHAAHVPKKRKKTKPTRASKQKRLNNKKIISEKKALRRHID